MDDFSDQRSLDDVSYLESATGSISIIEEGRGSRSSATAAAEAQRRNEDNAEPRALVKRETWIVARLKTILLAVLICAAISISVATYYLFKRQECNLYKTQFNDFARTLVKSFYRSTSQKLWAANLVSAAFTSSVERTGQNYPNMTLSDWPIITAGARRLANASAITFSPLLYTGKHLAEWEAYTVSDYLDFEIGASWIPQQGPAKDGRTIADGIYAYAGDTRVDDEEPGPYAPIWQISPNFNNSESKMYNQMAEKSRREAIENLIKVGGSVFSRVLHDESNHSPPHVDNETPRSINYFGVSANNFYTTPQLAGVIGVEFEWENYFGRDFPDQFNGMVIVLESTVGQSFTFKITAGEVNFSGKDDRHDTEFDDMMMPSEYEAFHGFCQYGIPFFADTYVYSRRVEEEVDFSEPPNMNFGPDDASYDLTGNHTIHYRVRIYPSQEFKRSYVTNEPPIFAVGVAAIFVFTSAIFMLYDRFVEKRQRVTMKTAERSSAVVNSLFPENVRERLFRNEEERQSTTRRTKSSKGSHERRCSDHSQASRILPEPAKLKIKSFLDGDNQDGDDADVSLSPPIADLFPHTTVLFADIVGFTAWSSEREPAQVFQLLETLYRKFDRLAEKLNVFKVETIGDCYVAVTGLPEPHKDHAVLMSRFAWEIRLTMRNACKKLESVLGPGTADLCLRIGLHSGPVTAGVLRGEKSRFQLFGDTMNTAARMESLSMANSIQVSQSTANLLTSSGKQHWLTPRDIMVEAKGKGTLQTYWLRPTKRLSSTCSHSDHSPCENRQSTSFSVSGISCDGYWTSDFLHKPVSTTQNKPARNVSNDSHNGSENYQVTCEKTGSLIDWNVDVLMTNLQKVVATSQETGSDRRKRIKKADKVTDFPEGTPIEELTEIIELPKFNSRNARQKMILTLIDADVEAQLRSYVTSIAKLYRNNPFHNLEHASHVTMSANKLMNRIMVPEDVDYEQGSETQRMHAVKLAESVHKSTFGISSDALTQFAIVFSALIHDVDHTGLTNAQLVKEGADVAVVYNSQSVAEQNSVTVAWSLLLEPQYEKLFQTICPTLSECKRFRQLVVAAVLATDIIDSDLQQLRKKRWDQTFQGSGNSTTISGEEKDVNRKATIVIEHLIQASDVAHTMQHWHIYCKWNEKLFQEKYRAFVTGHDDEEPSEYWYNNELAFFDKYVIPLAKKLRECGVFGVSSYEYLGFAVENRMEWEMKGKSVVAVVLRRAQQKYGFLVPSFGALEDTRLADYESPLSDNL